MRRHRILFLAANPAGTAALKLDEEARDIQNELRSAYQRDQFEFVPRVAARPLDLLHALRDVKPSVVHFAGHAETTGVYLTGDDGLPALVTHEALTATFGAVAPVVQIVVLNGCSTDEIAKSLCEFVPVCIGTSASIADDASRAFSIGFFAGLASSESARRAYLQGKAAMQLTRSGDHDRPRIRHRRDIDPDTLVLAGIEPADAARPPAILDSKRVTPRADSGAPYVNRSTFGSGPASSRYRITLEVATPDGSKTRRTFESSTIRIGAFPYNDLVVSDDRISGEHGLFRVRNDDMTYEDLSRNGTTLIRNEGKKSRQELHRRSVRIDILDRVELGGSGISVRLTRISRGR
jgi:hypothetical protein